MEIMVGRALVGMFRFRTQEGKKGRKEGRKKGRLVIKCKYCVLVVECLLVRKMSWSVVRK